MADDLSNLSAMRSNVIADLLALSDPSARAASYNVDGQQVSWTEYQAFKMQQLKDIDDAIARTSPFETLTYGSDF